MKTVRSINISGTHYQLGWQHGLQVKDLRVLILNAIKSRMKTLGNLEKFDSLIKELLEELQSIAIPTIKMIQGQADALEIDFPTLLKYAVASYLEDNLLSSGTQTIEGCSTWAASNGATGDGEPILVKNRDYYLEHFPLQIVTKVKPEKGYRYVCVGSAGSPGVFGSGMNETGLCVADTRVRCLDNGPGLPCYSLMMHILEEYREVTSALDYLKEVNRMGGSNIIIADAKGDLAVLEVGHRNYGLVKPGNHLVVNTNHFVSLDLKAQFVDTNPPGRRGTSFHRYDKLEEELRTSYGRIDLKLARRLMASHDDTLSAICRHQESIMEKMEGTISTAIYLPAKRELLFCNGKPCQGKYQIFSISGEIETKEDEEPD